MPEEAGQHQSVCLAREVNWLWVWEAARDRGQNWTNILQSLDHATMCVETAFVIHVCVIIPYLKTPASSHMYL